MPRLIIDTESSRGRLVRRRLVVAVLIVALLIVLVLALLSASPGFHHAQHLAFQGNSPPRWNLRSREHAA